MKKIAQMGVKKVSLMMAGVVAATTIAGVTISNSLTENRTEDGSNSGIEETYTTTRDWRTDYARILLETYYLTEEAAEIYENDWDEQNYPTGGFFFGLLDANDDGVPELFVGSSDHTPYAGEVYMFTAGDNIKECYVGRVYSGFFENGELVQCGVEEETDYAVCKFNGKELVEKKRFELNDKVYEQYVGEFNFMLEEYWLDVDTIMSALNVEIGEKGRQILGEAESCLVHHDGTVEKIYFNDDEEPDYIFGYTYFVYMLISSGDNYTKTTFSTSTATENELFYREKESVMFRTSAYSSGSKDLSGSWLTESNEWGKSIQIIKNVYGDYVQYSYYEDGTSVEITEGEFEQKYNDMLKNVVGLFEGETYTNMSEIIDMVEFVVLE